MADMAGYSESPSHKFEEEIGAIPRFLILILEKQQRKPWQFECVHTTAPLIYFVCPDLARFSPKSVPSPATSGNAWHNEFVP